MVNNQKRKVVLVSSEVNKYSMTTCCTPNINLMCTPLSSMFASSTSLLLSLFTMYYHCSHCSKKSLYFFSLKKLSVPSMVAQV